MLWHAPLCSRCLSFLKEQRLYFRVQTPPRLFFLVRETLFFFHTKSIVSEASSHRRCIADDSLVCDAQSEPLRREKSSIAKEHVHMIQQLLQYTFSTRGITFASRYISVHSCFTL
jgi:hypothetical protein